MSIDEVVQNIINLINGRLEENGKFWVWYA
jgi:hypothetical protein